MKAPANAPAVSPAAATTAPATRGCGEAHQPGLGLLDGVRVPLGLPLVERVSEGELLSEGVRLPVAVSDALAPEDLVRVTLPVAAGVPVRDTALLVGVPVGVSDADAVSDAVWEAVAPLDSVADGELVAVAAGLADSDGGTKRHVRLNASGGVRSGAAPAAA